MERRLARGAALSEVAAGGGVIAIQHITRRRNLVSILKEGALAPASRRKGAPVATNEKNWRGGEQPALGAYGFNRVFLSAVGVESSGKPLFLSKEELKAYRLKAQDWDHAVLVFSNKILDHLSQGRLSHLQLGWTYGESNNPIKPREPGAMADYFYHVASGHQNELVFKDRVPLTHLKAILVPAEHLAETKAELERNHIALPPDVQLLAVTAYPGSTTKARKWLSERPVKETHHRDGTVEVEDL